MIAPRIETQAASIRRVPPNPIIRIASYTILSFEIKCAVVLTPRPFQHRQESGYPISKQQHSRGVLVENFAKFFDGRVVDDVSSSNRRLIFLQPAKP